MGSVTKRQLERYPIYLKFLIAMRNSGLTHISSPTIAKVMGSSEEQVRKDFQAICSNSGCPKKGRNINELIEDIETFLGYKKTMNAVLIGIGNLGGAFIKFNGFKEFGLNIVAGFDVDPNKIDKTIDGVHIYNLDELEAVLYTLGDIEIAIITVPSKAAQGVVDRVSKLNIKGIWNFVPVHLTVRNPQIAIENVDLQTSLAILTHKINEIEGNSNDKR